jgi:hypothetical protein
MLRNFFLTFLTAISGKPSKFNNVISINSNFGEKVRMLVYSNSVHQIDYVHNKYAY